MKRFLLIMTVVAGVGLLFSACTKQCDCHKITHYSTYSTDNYYTETVDMGESCSSLNKEVIHEDVYGNPVSADEITCVESL